jgi:predicted metal-dependent hydrolase
MMVSFTAPQFCDLLQISQQLRGRAAVQDLLEQGIIFFNAGQYFEAHEAWEDLWRPARGPLRLYYQGLVQAAVGLHHLHHANPNGARAQLTKALSKLEEYPDRFCRIDNRKLIDDLRAVLDGAVSGEVTIHSVR